MKTNASKKAMGHVINAVFSKDLFRLRSTLEAGENVDERDRDGRTALHHACIENREDLVDILLHFKARVIDADNNGWTPLHFAAQSYGVNIARKLLQLGAPVDAVDSYGNTPLHRAVFESMGRGDMILLLLKQGADRDRKNNHGVSPADLASTIANFDVAQWLGR